MSFSELLKESLLQDSFSNFKLNRVSRVFRKRKKMSRMRSWDGHSGPAKRGDTGEEQEKKVHPRKTESPHATRGPHEGSTKGAGATHQVRRKQGENKGSCGQVPLSGVRAKCKGRRCEGTSWVHLNVTRPLYFNSQQCWPVSYEGVLASHVFWVHRSWTAPAPSHLWAPHSPYTHCLFRCALTASAALQLSSRPSQRLTCWPLQVARFSGPLLPFDSSHTSSNNVNARRLSAFGSLFLSSWILRFMEITCHLLKFSIVFFIWLLCFYVRSWD